MSEELKNLHNNLKIVNKRAYDDIETNFADLVALVNQLDPIKLLSQLTLTFQTTPEDQFNDESSDIR